jgi:hypothetical protein
MTGGFWTEHWPIIIALTAGACSLCMCLGQRGWRARQKLEADAKAVRLAARYERVNNMLAMMRTESTNRKKVKGQKRAENCMPNPWFPDRKGIGAHLD